MNLSFLAKLGWCFFHENSSLWMLVLRGKYNRHKADIEKFLPKVGSSHVWQSLTKAAPTLFKGMRKRAINGKNISFWADVWLDSFPLSSFLLHEIELVELHKRVFDYWTPGLGSGTGQFWRICCLQIFLINWLLVCC